MGLNNSVFKRIATTTERGLAARGRRIAGQPDPAKAKDNLFRVRDWAGVTELLNDEARSKQCAISKGAS